MPGTSFAPMRFMQKFTLLFSLILATFAAKHANAFAQDTYKQCLELGAVAAALGGKLTSPVPEEWTSSQFSDPRSHDPKHFVYIVHGVGSDHHDLQNLNLGTFVDYTWVSIISNDAPFTYTQESGLILAIEPDNIISNSCYDTVFTFPHSGDEAMWSKEIQAGFEKYSQLHRLLSPRQMLLGTIWSRFISEQEALKIVSFLPGEYYRNNELLLKGRSDSGNVVRTVGVYINKKDEYLPTIEALKDFARKYDLPVIEISP